MGLFTPTKTTKIEGVIDRIGVLRVSDMSLDYGFTIVGHQMRYVAYAYPLRAEWDLALAQPGDHVAFVTKDTAPHLVHADLTVRNAARI